MSEQLKENIGTYRENHDSVELMTKFEKKKFWEKKRTVISVLQNYIPNQGPQEFDIHIKSPDTQTDWTRVVWCIYSEVKKLGFTGTFTKDVLEEMEDCLSRNLKLMRNNDTTTTDDLTRVVRRLENSEQTTVSFTMWKEKVGVFCTLHQKQKFVSDFYKNVMGILLQVNRYVNYKRPDKQRINELIKKINETVDDDNRKFRDRYLSRFTFRNHEENIMDTLKHLPDELRETSPRSRTPSRTGVGGYRSINMSELLLAFQTML